MTRSPALDLALLSLSAQITDVVIAVDTVAHRQRSGITPDMNKTLADACRLLALAHRLVREAITPTEKEVTA